MSADSSLQNKYNRLCVEFNKLRKKHNDYRESVTAQINELQESEKRKNIRVCELECECENLRSKLSKLSEQFSRLIAAPDDGCQCSPSASREIPAATEEPAGNSEFSITPVEDPPPSTIPRIPDSTIESLTSTLQQWIANMTSLCTRKFELPESQSVLLSRISQLEYEVSDLSVQLQLERKRRVTNGKKSLCQSDESQTDTPVSPPESDHSIEPFKLMVDILRSRVESSEERAQHFSVLATFLQEELRPLVHYMSCLARQLQTAHSELDSSRLTVQRLTAELDSLKQSTLKQNNALATHVAQLTEELQNWRGSNPGSTEVNSVRSKKNTLLNVLKR